jgi:hypothetical protein
VDQAVGVAEAAANNAAWCDAVARTHGIGGTLDVDAWTAPVRTPALFPDAVTLRREVDAATMLGRIDAGPGASVKDSFAALDLTAPGFSVLFDATWLARPPRAGSLLGEALRFGVVSPSGFPAWEAAWRGDGPRDVLRPGLLDAAAVTALASVAADGSIVGGAVLFASTNAVVGVSNVFAPADSLGAAWRGVVAWAELHAPGATLVGYETGADLAAARRVGFAPLGPLRVWLRD